MSSGVDFAQPPNHCLCCSTLLDDDDDSVKCDICGVNAFATACLGLTKMPPVGLLAWKCSSCEKLSIFSLLERFSEKLKRIDYLENEITFIRNSMDTNVNAEESASANKSFAEVVRSRPTSVDKQTFIRQDSVSNMRSVSREKKRKLSHTDIAPVHVVQGSSNVKHSSGSKGLHHVTHHVCTSF